MSEMRLLEGPKQISHQAWFTSNFKCCLDQCGDIFRCLSKGTGWSLGAVSLNWKCSARGECASERVAVYSLVRPSGRERGS